MSQIDDRYINNSTYMYDILNEFTRFGNFAPIGIISCIYFQKLQEVFRAVIAQNIQLTEAASVSATVGNRKQGKSQCIYLALINLLHFP